MSVCSSYGCDNKTDPGVRMCKRCAEEVDALRRPENQPKPINWWAVFVVFSVIAAYGVLHAVGRI